MLIETEAQYETAMAELLALMGAAPDAPANSQDGKRINELADAILAYEKKMYPELFEQFERLLQ